MTVSSGDQMVVTESAKEIASWARAQGFGVVVWTALSSNFAEQVNTLFSVQAAIGYLKGLPAPAKVKAVEYHLASSRVRPYSSSMRC